MFLLLGLILQHRGHSAEAKEQLLGALAIRGHEDGLGAQFLSLCGIATEIS